MANITESTVNAIVGQYLDKFVNVLPEESVNLKGATRKQPDFSISHEQDGIKRILYIEAEWENKWLDGYAQAIAYGNIPNADASPAPNVSLEFEEDLK